MASFRRSETRSEDMRWASSQVHGNRPRLFTLLVETTPSPPPLSLPLPLPAFRSFVLEKTHVFFSSLSLVCVNLFGMQRILHWLTSSFSRAPSISWRQMNPSLMSMWPKWSAMAPAGCIPRQASGTQRSLKLWFFKRWGGGKVLSSLLSLLLFCVSKCRFARDPLAKAKRPCLAILSIS